MRRKLRFRSKNTIATDSGALDEKLLDAGVVQYAHLDILITTNDEIFKVMSDFLDMSDTIL